MRPGRRAAARVGGSRQQAEQPDAGTVVLEVHVIPRARHSALAGRRGGAWLVRLQAPPVDGAANAALLDVLGRALGIPPRQMAIVSGATARRKRVRITGLAPGEVEVRLAAQGTG